MTIRLHVTDRRGDELEVRCPATGTLMEVLRELGNGVAAICGGMLSCGTCHVHLAPEWIGKLPRPQGDERDLIAGLQCRADTSRLSCQIHLSEELDGLRLRIAAEE